MTITTGKLETGLNASVAGEIRAWMGRRGVRQSQLARMLGENEQWLSTRLRGATPLNLNDLGRIAQALSVNVVDFLPHREREVTTPYVAPSMIPAPRNPMKGLGQPERTGRTGRPMVNDPLSQAAQRSGARRDRQLQPCG